MPHATLQSFADAVKRDVRKIFQGAITDLDHKPLGDGAKLIGMRYGKGVDDATNAVVDLVSDHMNIESMHEYKPFELVPFDFTWDGNVPELPLSSGSPYLTIPIQSTIIKRQAGTNDLIAWLVHGQSAPWWIGDFASMFPACTQAMIDSMLSQYGRNPMYIDGNEIVEARKVQNRLNLGQSPSFSDSDPYQDIQDLLNQAFPSSGIFEYCQNPNGNIWIRGYEPSGTVCHGNIPTDYATDSEKAQWLLSQTAAIGEWFFDKLSQVAWVLEATGWQKQVDQSVYGPVWANTNEPTYNDVYLEFEIEASRPGLIAFDNKGYPNGALLMDIDIPASELAGAVPNDIPQVLDELPLRQDCFVEEIYNGATTPIFDPNNTCIVGEVFWDGVYAKLYRCLVSGQYNAPYTYNISRNAIKWSFKPGVGGGGGGSGMSAGVANITFSQVEATKVLIDVENVDEFGVSSHKTTFLEGENVDFVFGTKYVFEPISPDFDVNNVLDAERKIKIGQTVRIDPADSNGHHWFRCIGDFLPVGTAYGQAGVSNLSYHDYDVGYIPTLAEITNWGLPAGTFTMYKDNQLYKFKYRPASTPSLMDGTASIPVLALARNDTVTINQGPGTIATWYYDPNKMKWQTDSVRGWILPQEYEKAYITTAAPSGLRIGSPYCPNFSRFLQPTGYTPTGGVQNPAIPADGQQYTYLQNFGMVTADGASHYAYTVITAANGMPPMPSIPPLAVILADPVTRIPYENSMWNENVQSLWFTANGQVTENPPSMPLTYYDYYRFRDNADLLSHLQWFDYGVPVIDWYSGLYCEKDKLYALPAPPPVFTILKCKISGMYAELDSQPHDTIVAISDKSVIHDVDFPIQNEHVVAELTTGDGTKLQRYIPLASLAPNNDGLMSVADKLQLAQHKADIESLKGLGRLGVHFGSNDPADNPQYGLVSGSAMSFAWLKMRGMQSATLVPEGASIDNVDQAPPAGHVWTFLNDGMVSEGYNPSRTSMNDPTQSAPQVGEYFYDPAIGHWFWYGEWPINTGNAWNELGDGQVMPTQGNWWDRGIDTVNRAENNVLGVVQGEPVTEGYVNIDGIGKMFVNGFTQLKQDVTQLSTTLNNFSTTINNITSSNQEPINPGLATKLLAPPATLGGQPRVVDAPVNDTGPGLTVLGPSFGPVCSITRTVNAYPDGASRAWFKATFRGSEKMKLFHISMDGRSQIRGKKVMAPDRTTERSTIDYNGVYLNQDMAAIAVEFDPNDLTSESTGNSFELNVSKYTLFEVQAGELLTPAQGKQVHYLIAHNAAERCVYSLLPVNHCPGGVHAIWQKFGSSRAGNPNDACYPGYTSATSLVNSAPAPDEGHNSLIAVVHKAHSYNTWESGADVENTGENEWSGSYRPLFVYDGRYGTANWTDYTRYGITFDLVGHGVYRVHLNCMLNFITTTNGVGMMAIGGGVRNGAVGTSTNLSTITNRFRAIEYIPDTFGRAYIPKGSIVITRKGTFTAGAYEVAFDGLFSALY